MQFVYVFIGGGLGSVFRFAIGKAIPFHHGVFPYATLYANILSSFILGILIGYAFRYGMADEYKWLLMAGFCGGFSTFSTFSAESITLLERQQPLLMIIYILVSIVSGMLAVLAGLKIVSSI